MTSQKTFPSERLLSGSGAKPGPAPAIWSAHKPASEASVHVADADHRAAKLTHDMNHSLSMPLAFAGYLATKGGSEPLRRRASCITQSLQECRSMLLAFMQVSAPDKNQVAGMMTGMLDDMGSILKESLAFAKTALDRSDLPQAADRMAEMAVRHLEKAECLLQELKSASPLPRPKGAVDLSSLLQSVIEMAASGAMASGRLDGFQFSFSVKCGLPSVEGDPAALERVFSNLVANAVDAMPRGGKLRVDARAHGEYVLVDITDSGTGMDDKTLSGVFQPFFTTKGEEGTGLGLAIVNEVVKAHGGQVTVRSSPGRGTTFQVALPAHAEHF